MMPLTPLRLMNVIEVSERDDQVDLAILFNCSMRFVSAIPVSEGQRKCTYPARTACRLRRDAAHADLAGAAPPISGGAGIVTAARTESLAPGQITLTIDFKKSERFVIAQGIDPRGLRLRLVDRSRGHPKIIVGQTPETVSNYAINLDSQPKPFSSEELARAHRRLKVQPSFQGHGRRCEVVPTARPRGRSSGARRQIGLLKHAALAGHPCACWLAIGDDAVTSDVNAPAAVALPPVERIGADPPLPPEMLHQMLTEARKAMDAP